MRYWGFEHSLPQSLLSAALAMGGRVAGNAWEAGGRICDSTVQPQVLTDRSTDRPHRCQTQRLVEVGGAGGRWRKPS